MNAFDSARTVEARAMAKLIPFLEEHDGKFIVTAKGRLAPLLQEIVGDILYEKKGLMWGIEVKAEETWTGNLFIEIWSNRNLDDADKNAKVGSNRGWLEKLRCNLLFYYFLDKDVLYIIDYFALKQWAFGHHDTPGNLLRYPMKRQGKRAQANDTWAHLVKIDDLRRDLGAAFRETSVQQLSLPLPVAAE